MSKRKKLFVALVGVAILAIGGIAYALWNATGSGSGSAKAETAQVTLTVDTNAPAELYPGGTGALYFTATNAQDFNMTFDNITSATAAPDAGHSACHLAASAPAVTVDTGSFLPTVTIDAGENGTTEFSIPGVVHMDAAAPNECQGATFTITFTLSGSQS
jgi:hypothetical protein